MRSAESILNIVRERGSRGLPLEDVYRQLFNPALYLLAYGKIAANAGALTPGATGETADGMSLAKIQAIIEKLRYERYRWTPVRRVYIEKKGSVPKRPLGIPTWSDKLLQEVIRRLLEAYYEPQFSPRSHGFRPGRGCHTALDEIHHAWTGTVWFLEGDISRCFDSLDHDVLLALLREKIHDNRFLRLIGNLLKAGYLEDWQYNRTLSGSPQGGIVSPILSNIYLDRLDQFVETVLIPHYTRGAKRRTHLLYRRLGHQRSYWASRDPQRARQLLQELRKLPSQDPADPEYRRLHYLRYADDFLLGFAGPRTEAEAITQRLGTFLRESLKLELSETKTLITHGRTAPARFLGYDVVVMHSNEKITNGRRSVTAGVGLKVPISVVRAKCTRYLRHGKPTHLAQRLNDDVFSIVAQYESEYRGVVAYYRRAFNLHRFSRLKWVMERSLVTTLAAKLRISTRQVYRRYQTRIRTDHGSRRVLRVRIEREGKKPLVATWGRTDLQWDAPAILDDHPMPVWNHRSEIVERLLADTCELCGSQEQVEVHHVRALKDLHRPGQADKPAWARVMAARHRKKLVVCHVCHLAITHGRPPRRTNRLAHDTGEPGDAKVSRPVRRGADGKVSTAALGETRE
jgi:group II intron reverse transcriptase/maturase